MKNRKQIMSLFLCGLIAIGSMQLPVLAADAIENDKADVEDISDGDKAIDSNDEIIEEESLYDEEFVQDDFEAIERVSVPENSDAQEESSEIEDKTVDGAQDLQGDSSVIEDSSSEIYTPLNSSVEDEMAFEDYGTTQIEESVGEKKVQTPLQNSLASVIEKCTVTFDANGGYFPDPEVPIHKFEDGSDQYRKIYKTRIGDNIYAPELIEHNDPSLHFVGWSYSSNGEIEYYAHECVGSNYMAEIDSTSLQASNCTLYAVWSRDILDTGYNFGKSIKTETVI